MTPELRSESCLASIHKSTGDRTMLELPWKHPPSNAVLGVCHVTERCWPFSCFTAVVLVLCISTQCECVCAAHTNCISMSVVCVSQEQRKCPGRCNWTSSRRKTCVTSHKQTYLLCCAVLQIPSNFRCKVDLHNTVS